RRPPLRAVGPDPPRLVPGPARSGPRAHPGVHGEVRGVRPRPSRPVVLAPRPVEDGRAEAGGGGRRGRRAMSDKRRILHVRPVQFLLYLALRAVVMVVHMFPYRMVRSIGRLAGRVLYVVDRKHVNIAAKN